MILSMTAFARSECTDKGIALVWEVRSVNHRYLETALRLPEDFRALEPAVREMLASRLGRGKIDCTLRFSKEDLAGADFEIDHQAVDRLVEAMRSVSAKLWDTASVSSLDLMRWPGVVKTPQLRLDDIRDAALSSLSEALDELVENRQREGNELARVLLERIEQMRKLVASIRERVPEIMVANRAKLHARLSELLSQVDEGRMEQELAYLLQKLDVDEEMDRLSTHLEEVQRVIDRGGKVGRRLDFLMQELNREANTTASKSNDAVLTQMAVEMKVLVEQMREQVQNIE